MKELHGRKATLETSGEDEKLHSKRVKKIERYTRSFHLFPTRSECNFRCLQISPPVHVTCRLDNTIYGWAIARADSLCYKMGVKTTLETGWEDVKLHSKRVEKRKKLHSKRVEKRKNYTRNELRRLETTLVPSGEVKNYTRNEWRTIKGMAACSSSKVMETININPVYGCAASSESKIHSF